MLDGPPAPRDTSLRNIIDKLAEFVARNGPEFEMITKQKQHGNPKFEFLYGGEYAGYYQYRVAAEQAFLKQGGMSQSASHQLQTHHMGHPQHSPQGTAMSHYTQGPPPSMHHSQNQGSAVNPHDSNAFNMNQPQSANANHLLSSNTTNGNSLAMNLTSQIEAINIQQSSLRDQIHQSESNLTAQHSAMMAQQKKQIDEAIELAQNTQLEKQADENGISLREFDVTLQPIIESCTKDSISSGKNWILQHSSDSAKSNVVLQYLLKKALVNGSTFQQKLHLIYLVNDILHHCVRKNSNDLKNSLENVVIPMFCSADLIANKDQRIKLTKLLSLWESKAKFFDACVISKLQSPDSSMQEYKTNLQNLHQDIVTKFVQSTKSTLDNYQKQHQIFIQHATQQIAQLEQQKQQMEKQMLAAVLPTAALMPQSQPPAQTQPQQQQQPPKIPALMAQKITMPGSDDDLINPPGVDDNYNTGNSNNHRFQAQQQTPNNMYGAGNGMFSPSPGGAMGQQHNHFAHDSMQQAPPNFFIPDLSKPPPGFQGVAGANQLPQALQQQYAQMGNNIPPSSNAGVVGGAGPGPGGMSVSGDANAAAAANIDVMALNAAIQLVLKQQNQQQQQQQQQQQHQQQQQQQAHLLDAVAQHFQQHEQLQQLQQPSQHPQQQQLENQQQSFADDVSPPQSLSQPEEEQKPSAPYYDLPAGLMVPLIRLDDYTYKPLDPTEIRLPAPAPQNERLTNALTAFYAPPTHDRPRDTDGWEKLGLYEYYKVKNAARKQKEEEIQKGIRDKTRSPSPIVLEKPKPKKLNKRCYLSKSRSRSKSRSPYRSPPPRSSNRRNNRRNRSPRRSPPPPRERNIDRERDRDRDSSTSSRENRPERNNTRRERERSVTPPSFFGSNFAKPNEFIEESNKGHQMLMKMGWGGTGTGLGTKQQGIEQPISGGEVRDRKDMFKGVGVNLNDPFENFRKNKGAAFVHRMRARDDKS